MVSVISGAVGKPHLPDLMVSVISGAVGKPHLPDLMVSVISGAVGKPHLPDLRFMNYIDYDIVVNAKTVPIGGAGFIYCNGFLWALGMSMGIEDCGMDAVGDAMAVRRFFWGCFKMQQV